MSTFPHYFTWDLQPDHDRFPVERAEGDEFVLTDGRRIYDFMSTSFQASFGHSEPHIRQAIHRQLDAMPIASPKASFRLKQRVSERLIELLGLSGGKLFYTLSGSESVENALKMARQVSGRTVILARQKSYHGATLGALSVTGDWRNPPHFTIREQTVRIPEPSEDPDLSRTRRVIQETGVDRIAALIVETISGTNGVVIPASPWLPGLQSLCRELGILFIMDEVLCGFGRTGPPFAFQHYHLEPDFVCASKAITGGYVPLGVVWTGPRVVDFYAQEKLTCGLTNYAHPLGLAALDAVLDLFADPQFQEQKGQLEVQFGRRMQNWADRPEVSDVRCRGLFAAIDFHAPVVPSWEFFFANGLHLFRTPTQLILAPPFISHPDRLNAALDVLENSFSRGKVAE